MAIDLQRYAPQYTRTDETAFNTMSVLREAEVLKASLGAAHQNVSRLFAVFLIQRCGLLSVKVVLHKNNFLGFRMNHIQ